jgi:hypothetical protein
MLKGLCVGINKFKNYPESNLRGCVNDSCDMLSYFTNKFKIKKNEIMLLTDFQATKANVMRYLNLLVKNESGKNEIFFSISSHGSQIKDTNGDENDKIDEVFCCSNLAEKGNDWNRDTIIVDDELNKLFMAVDKSVTLRVFADTCFSGTMLKHIPGGYRQSRFMPNPRGIFTLPAKSLCVKIKEYFSANKKTNKILWAACRPEQTSADAYIAGGYHGAFTYWYLQNAGFATDAKILAETRKDLKKNKFEQIPQLEFY